MLMYCTVEMIYAYILNNVRKDIEICPVVLDNELDIFLGSLVKGKINLFPNVQPSFNIVIVNKFME